MPTIETISGQQRAWNLLDKLGEGDAGEVYRVESIIDHRIAILKRPRRSSFPSDIIRQAAQIEKEAQALRVLAQLEPTSQLIRTPTLLDQSQPGSEFTERFFIVITPATGFNLAYLARATRFGAADLPAQISPEPTLAGPVTPAQPPGSSSLPAAIQQAFLERLVQYGKLPELILLRAIYGLIGFLETIHILSSETPTDKVHGILWNDVKPDHFFYDPLHASFTLIDWGNAQFLQADGATKDRQHSRIGDYLQVISEMGRFLSDTDPDLLARLAWPVNIGPGQVYSNGILPLKERLGELVGAEEAALRAARRSEADLLQGAGASYDRLEQLALLHNQIFSYGEIPDYQGGEQFFLRLGGDLILDGNLSRFGDLCRLGQKMPLLDVERCQLLGQMAAISLANSPSSKGLPGTALLAGLNGDWPNALWELRLAALDTPEPAWWEELSDAIRNQETGSLALRPQVALNRLVHTLQAASLKASTEPGSNDRDLLDSLIHTLKDEILPHWTQAEPDPPDSGIEYREIDRFLGQEPITQALALLPEAHRALIQALDQPRAQANIAMDAWNRQDFDAARRALRRILVWDPDRRRLLEADRALEHAPAWLAEVRRGLIKDEPLSDLVSRLELSGRELRNQVGAAGWLDALLDALSQLRKGAEPTEVLSAQSPQARENLAWLIALEPRRPLLASPDKTLQLERRRSPWEYDGASQEERPILYGMKESSLNRGAGVQLNEPLDTWAPEARGSSARLFLGLLPAGKDAARPAAIKVMRPDRIEYALPLFQEEARVLALLRDIAGIVPMIECGFIRLDASSELPPEERSASAGQLQGEVLRYGLDSVHNFLADLNDAPQSRLAQGWLPYLAIEKQERSDNLLLRCDTGYTAGRFLPTLEGLVMAIQCCDILEAVHARNIVYRDHKILHYYWNDQYNGIFMIDWNIAKRYPEGLRESDIQFDLVQFGARALHYMLTGRAAPGALPLGPNRPEEIEAAARTYNVRWTYDDQRLPKDIKDLLEAVLAGNYHSARQLSQDLQSIYSALMSLSRAMSANSTPISPDSASSTQEGANHDVP